MLNETQKEKFYNWAQVRVGFNYNKYTKRLTLGGKHFEELPLPCQFSAIIEWLDYLGCWIIVNPVDNPNWWTYQILMKDISAPFYQVYELPLDDESLTNRFLATEAAIKKALELI